MFSFFFERARVSRPAEKRAFFQLAPPPPLSLSSHLDGVVRGLGQVAPEARHRAREVERRRRRVDRRPDDSHGLQRRVGRVFQSRRRHVAVDKGVAGRVHQRLGALEGPVARGLEDDALVDVPVDGRVDEVGREDAGRGDDDLGGRGGGGDELSFFPGKNFGFSFFRQQGGKTAGGKGQRLPVASWEERWSARGRESVGESAGARKKGLAVAMLLLVTPSSAKSPFARRFFFFSAAFRESCVLQNDATLQKQKALSAQMRCRAREAE